MWHILSPANITDTIFTENKTKFSASRSVDYTQKKNTYFIKASSEDSPYIEEEEKIREENFVELKNILSWNGSTKIIKPNS